MTIYDALISINSYPIPDNAIEKFCIDRGLGATTEYTKAIGLTDKYKLATADVYNYLSKHLDLSEQEVSISNQAEIKEQFLSDANDIYKDLDPDKFTGDTVGFTGDKWNG